MLQKLWVLLMLAILLPLPGLGEATDGSAIPPEHAFINDVVFVGDSVTNQIRRYRTSMRNEGQEIFGSARFLSAGAYSLYLAGFEHALQDEPTLFYRGRNVGLGQGLAAMKAKKVYILLGLADDPGLNPDRDRHRYTKMISQIRRAVPDIEITALSVTPITERGQSLKTTQNGIDRFNVQLQSLCKELGIAFVDIATPLKNEAGYLDGALSSDKKVHLNEDGLKILTETLHQYAREQLGIDRVEREAQP